MTQLLDACKLGHLKEVKGLLSLTEADVNSRNEKGQTCVMLACASGNESLVKYLIEERGASIKEKSKHGGTCLMNACRVGHLPTVKYLVEERGAHIEEKDRFGNTCLLSACATGHLPVVKYLIEEGGADTKVKFRRGNTCMNLACANGYLPIVEYLIVENWMKPPSSKLNSSKRMTQFLRQCTPEFVAEKRRQRFMNMKQLIHSFKLDTQLESSQNISPFCQAVPLVVTHLYTVVESKEYPMADLKVYIPLEGSPTLHAYAKRHVLSSSCPFMEGLLSSEMNDVHDHAEEEDMPTVELCEDILQGCPTQWMKQLIIFLSWSKKKDGLLRHYVRSSAVSGRFLFEDMVDALKYCRMCDTLGLHMDLTAWTDMIRRQMLRYNKQWIRSAMVPQHEKASSKFCIGNITPFDAEMSNLWIRVLGEDDDLHFFILVNASRAPNETAANSANWLMLKDASGKYRESLQNANIASMIDKSTGFRIVDRGN